MLIFSFRCNADKIVTISQKNLFILQMLVFIFIKK